MRSSMLTTSPTWRARQSSNRIVRASTRTLSPSREISPDDGLTHQSPMRSLGSIVRRFYQVDNVAGQAICAFFQDEFRIFQSNFRTYDPSLGYVCAIVDRTNRNREDIL